MSIPPGESSDFLRIRTLVQTTCYHYLHFAVRVDGMLFLQLTAPNPSYRYFGGPIIRPDQTDWCGIVRDPDNIDSCHALEVSQAMDVRVTVSAEPGYSGHNARLFTAILEYE